MTNQQSTNPQPSTQQTQGDVHITVGDITDSKAVAIGQNITQNITINRIDYDDARNMRNHAVLRQAVYQFWVQGVLHHSLYHEVQLRLRVNVRPDAVDNEPWGLILRQPGVPDRALPEWAKPDTGTGQQRSLIDIFDALNQRMLILGSPGSGKTSTLLMLTEVLLKRHETDATLPTPVVFNLSSWQNTLRR